VYALTAGEHTKAFVKTKVSSAEAPGAKWESFRPQVDLLMSEHLLVTSESFLVASLVPPPADFSEQDNLLFSKGLLFGTV